ncbi:hypothetical protein JNW90_12440 [Micromonospora sp. STR1s_5]|nr:hypothetical protein [Micromonospora sp. STR1s_5]
MVRLQRLAVAHRPPLGDALPPGPSPGVEQIKINGIAVRRRPPWPDMELDMVPGDRPW